MKCLKNNDLRSTSANRCQAAVLDFLPRCPDTDIFSSCRLECWKSREARRHIMSRNIQRNNNSIFSRFVYWLAVYASAATTAASGCKCLWSAVKGNGYRRLEPSGCSRLSSHASQMLYFPPCFACRSDPIMVAWLAIDIPGLIVCGVNGLSLSIVSNPFLWNGTYLTSGRTLVDIFPKYSSAWGTHAMIEVHRVYYEILT